MLIKLSEAGLGNKPVIFVVNLLPRRCLQPPGNLKMKQLRNFLKTQKVLFFTLAPNEGSQIASLNVLIKYFFFPSVEFLELEMKYPAFLSLNQSFKQIVSKFRTKVFSFGETPPTRNLRGDLTIVPPESSNPGVG